MGLLRDARPDDAMLGEEGTASLGASGLRWVIDPLDGTVNFLYGQPTFAVSIACEDGEGPLVAVVHHPTSGETFTAMRGGGARLDGVELAVRRPESLAHALVATGSRTSPRAASCRVRWLRASCRSSATCAVRDLRRSIWRGSQRAASTATSSMD